MTSYLSNLVDSVVDNFLSRRFRGLLNHSPSDPELGRDDWTDPLPPQASDRMASSAVYKDSKAVLARQIGKCLLVGKDVDSGETTGPSVKAILKKVEESQSIKIADKKGLSDRTNNGMIAGYINKIRRDSTKGKETKKVPLVNHANKVCFKPGGHHVGSHASSKEKKPYAVRVPDYTVVNELSPMETDEPQVRIRQMMTRVPRGVIDIDAVNDPLKNTEYAQDICDYLLSVERRWTFPENYLINNKEITPHMRSVLVDWLIQVQVHLELHQTTLHLAVGLIDRFLTKQPVELSALQLVGITSLWIAAKFIERFPPEVADLCHLTDNTYSSHHVIRMERTILRKLDFDVNIPGPIVFLERFLLVRECKKVHLVQSMSMFILDLTLTELPMVHFQSSQLAAGAICLSRDLLGCEPAWDKGFSHYTKYSLNDLDLCIRALKRLLSKMHKSKFQGAHQKYSHKSFHGISEHHTLRHLSLHPTQLWPRDEEEGATEGTIV